MTDLAVKLAALSIARRLAEMAEKEQVAAEAILIDGPIKIGERDRHIARSGAFIEASRYALKAF